MKNILKLTIAGSVVFGIWFALLVLFPKPDAPASVADADADILSFDFAKQGDQEKFVEVLQEQGLEEPRMYDWNGNTMFFSTTTTSEPPRTVLRRFQEEFVRKGVNKKVHLVAAKRQMPEFMTTLDGMKGMQTLAMKSKASKSDIQELTKHKESALKSREVLDDFFGGGMLPTMVTEDHVYMVGMTSKNEARSGEEFIKEMGERIKDKKKFKSKEGSTLVNSVKSMRFLEAFKTGNGQTRITATWSDDKLDINKVAQKGEDLSVDPELPSCIGCERVNAFTGQSKGEKDYGVTVFNAKHQSIDQVMTFYTSALMKRGWLTSESSKVMLSAKQIELMPRNGSEMMTFARNGKFLNLLVHKNDDGETRVHLVQAN